MTIAQPLLPKRKQYVRTLWISEVHLGTRDCRAERLDAFLKRYAPERVYLVGDIWPAFLGDSAYEFTLTLNRWLNRWRQRWGYGYWSLSAWLKHKVKGAVSYISEFEEALAHECTRRGFHGVVCGHIHHAEIRAIGAIEYLNCGDWVESCSALIEHPDGRIELYRLAADLPREAPAEEAPGDAVTEAKA